MARQICAITAVCILLFVTTANAARKKRASQVQSTESETFKKGTVVQEEQLIEAEGAACLDPGTTDFHTVECACMREIKATCGDNVHKWGADCLLQSVCANPTVCADWKADNCEAASAPALVEQVAEELEVRRLQKKSDSKAGQYADANRVADETLGAKTCL